MIIKKKCTFKKYLLFCTHFGTDLLKWMNNIHNFSADFPFIWRQCWQRCISESQDGDDWLFDFNESY